MHDARPGRRRITIDATPRHTPLNREAFLTACAQRGAATDEERARLLGTSRRHLYGYITGEIEPKLSTARRIATRLDTHVDTLWPAA